METNTQKKLANQREITAKWLIAEELVGQTYWQFCKTVSRSVVTGRPVVDIEVSDTKHRFKLDLQTKLLNFLSHGNAAAASVGRTSI